MTVLHLVSNWKKTGPAELAANLAVGLADTGTCVLFACCRAPRGRVPYLSQYIHSRGFDRVFDLHLNKHFRPVSALRGICELRTLITENNVDIVHTHMPNDHLLGGLAARCTHRRPLIVSTDYNTLSAPPTCRTRISLRCFTDHLVVTSDTASASPYVRRYLPTDNVSIIRPGVDTVRFDPDRPLSADISLPFPANAIVAGIVARVQPHRQFELLLGAFAEAASSEPRLRLLVVGRGTHIKRVALDRVNELGLDGLVYFTGYLHDDAYVAAVKAFDFQIFLVPGSDATCRAARDGMALAKPQMVSERGILPELVEHEKYGIVVKETTNEIADGLLRMAQDASFRKRLGSHAREHILAEYSLDKQVSQTASLYHRLLPDKSS